MSDKVDISAIKIGDELFRYVEMGGIFRYVVIGVRSYEDSVQLEVECQTCSHGWKCRLLVAQDDYGKIVHVHMLNEDEDDHQRHWHTNDGYHFWLSSQEARAESFKRAISRAKEEVTKSETDLAARKKRLAELEALFGESA